ncbi:MAG TPA: tRNA (adenosine(37)-N6)-threonylcarbamoyltransferase complex ATPase subunit type 1 TsaE [Gemmataceae bacterium]|nr:tRNA (adenosine(37)-N6)-threonylcarbamoyltransferase complex ATPase subunit type 1 TsaE [Gemmataceae bacterium]
MAESLSIDLEDLSATEAFGRRLGELLFPAAVVGLIGPLGAGKTHLVRAVAEGLGIRDSGIVSSPTFVLIQEYDARLPVYHFDAYRLKNEGEFFDLGAHEYFESNGVCLIEWADRVPGCLPREHLTIRLEITGETSRRATIEPAGPRYEALVAQLRQPSSSASSESQRTSG